MTSGLLLEQELKKRILKDADKGTSYLAIKAAQDLCKGNVDPLDIDLIIMGTATPDMPVAGVYVLNRSYERFCF
jgi:3-oxoacyl-[acyl-carrier-protein] synthase-3